MRLLLLPLAASVVLSSCVDSGYSRYSGNGRYTTSASGYGVYSSLPRNYAGSAYFYGGRYYSGGTYQRGKYVHNGRTYQDRYVHNGKYLYGGVHQQRRANASRQASHQGRYGGDDRRHVPEQDQHDNRSRH